MRIAIAGAGIGGLTAALSLRAAGFCDITLFEAASDIRDVGVGINLPPHAVRELSELGLVDEIDAIGVRTIELAYYDPAGDLIWSEPRGIAAGYRWPQYSVHRGRLQRVLFEATEARLGRGAIRAGRRITGVLQESREVTLTTDGEPEPFVADVLIAADGIRSGLRDALCGTATPLATNGWVMYRGTTQAPPFLTGQSMVIIGDETQRCVVYPIAPGILNWLLVRPRADGHTRELGNWNVRLAPATVAAFAQPYRFDWLDVHRLIADAREAYEYPMADIDPLPQWVFGRCALLGDAAHAMYPFGSNGASQAILDARVLAYHLATGDVDVGLAAYEAARRPAASEVQLANRKQAGDVMARVSAMARQGARGNAAAELQTVERRYRNVAGFDVETLNSRASWDVAEASRLA